MSTEICGESGVCVCVCVWKERQPGGNLNTTIRAIHGNTVGHYSRKLWIYRKMSVPSRKNFFPLSFLAWLSVPYSDRSDVDDLIQPVLVDWVGGHLEKKRSLSSWQILKIKFYQTHQCTKVRGGG